MVKKNGETFHAGMGPLLEPNFNCNPLQPCRSLWLVEIYCPHIANALTTMNIMCHTFSLHDIVELLVKVKVTRHSLSTRPEHQSVVSTWKYTGRFFDFESVMYGGYDFPESLYEIKNALFDRTAFNLRKLFGLFIPELFSTAVYS